MTKPKNPKFISIPTTSTTPSQLTPFPLITHTHTHLNYPLPHYPLTPHIPILHPQFLLTLPKHLPPHTPIHLFTHPIQSYLSLMPSHYTTPLTLQAINLTFHYLK
uniref:iron-containing alcohol dehydrogenase n=1 Tax=Staphylococcus epidermidis TaxID=1282 RepID=UPI0011A28055